MSKETRTVEGSFTETVLTLTKVSALPVVLWGVEDLVGSVILNDINTNITSLAVKGSLRIIAACCSLVAAQLLQTRLTNN